MERSGYDSAFRAEIAERRQRRREIERRRRRTFRRRRLTAMAVVLALVGIPVLLLGGGGGDEEVSPATNADSAPPSGDRLADTARENADRGRTVRGFRGPVPILMYHVIDEAPPDAAHPELFVPPEELADQLDWLDAEGYEAVTLADVFGAWDEGAPIPKRPIVVSFDDGYRGQREHAAPELASHGWPGVINLKVEAVEQRELTARMVSEMLDAGWELGAHTITHPNLTTLDADALEREVAGSRRKLARRFSVPVDFFCYPAGRYDANVVGAVEAAGFRGATTVEPGLAKPSEPFELARIRINPGDGASGLQTKLVAVGAA